MPTMRKLFFSVLIVTCCFSVEANAQIPHFGAKIGLNFANVSGDNASTSFPNHGVKAGLAAGVFITYNLFPLLSIQPEILYSMKGTKGSAVTSASVPYDYAQTFNYIEIPVLLKLNLPLGPAVPFEPYVYAGPDFAFNVASNKEVTGQAVWAFTTGTKYLTSVFDFNVAAGVGAGFGLGPTALGLELRYTFGTGSLAKPGEGSLKNGVLAVMASLGL